MTITSQILRAGFAGSVVSLLLLCAAIAFTAAAEEPRWAKFTLPSTGVSLAVPTGVFEALPAPIDAQGRLFVSRDSRAQLLLGAFMNADNRTLRQHRKLVLAKNYPGAEVDYLRLKGGWFVISGTTNAKTFYQRVSFTCGGRLINSWAMIYPTTQKRRYDRIIERMHRTFRPGRGPMRDCQLSALTN